MYEIALNSRTEWIITIFITNVVFVSYSIINMTTNFLNTITSAIENREEELKKRKENAKLILKDFILCIENCQSRFGGKSELATEDDIRIVNLCEKWEKVLSHGLRTNLSNYTLQNFVTAGLNFNFNIINVGNSLWSYSCLHLTKHEKERFKILTNINTPLGYFRSFLRAALNERSLERYLQSWICHGLLLEYYDDGAIVRSEEANLLPNMAAGLSTVLFALSIDRAELNDSQNNSHMTKAELVIPLPTPVKPSHTKRKPLRQVISFDKESKNKGETPTKSPPIDGAAESWNSAPATCLNSPDPQMALPTASTSEPTSSDYKTGIRHFFPDGVKSIESPLQILSKLSESAKEIFMSSTSIEKNRDDSSDLSVNCLKIYESDSEEVGGSIDGSTSCLELCFTEDESVPDEKTLDSVLKCREKEFLSLQLKYNQIEHTSKDKIQKLEKVVLDLSRENDKLKEQLRNYMSAVEMGKAMKTSNGEDEEITQYERKLVQVAEMHAELMEFNQHLQRRLQDLESTGLEILDCPESNVKVYIPSAFLVGKKTHSYHVYQIFLKVGQEEWNVYHRYAKFYEMHTQLKKCHPDIANYKFPPKKTLRKRDARVVEQRRIALQAYLRHVLLVLPELRECTSRSQLITLLPFFGTSSTIKENGVNIFTRQHSNESASTYDPI
ncbi:sorting nexin-29 [Pieris rapae]|uniref:sorting nexin-29 n=1 Tax=Pieris rapae TaxID=64459 RepID=UPI001E27C46E|nr:sorting nexin-29 [Pieris rapae]XP_045484868.1 sorting nexin-29 [Pieris rapae]XP_045484869.1 sorting nexin-29 [Pieris rapae]XP_045484870.1 sorting nexin-29 [Pieris rapae]